ncbi:hypothetical protein CAPTEDRAFT_219841 [Capitella teleta]|uniref:Uncharacterized protein n=1 Tax=Capitella teleta TaxID=283909 RepID=R7VMA8_CAPTE|nr:hypothetical protein CAPTEDRAFT_219841 [Capitella teleta]|eukprot:ELU18515.1 hypothetical protein CAPTEDRAFT_219841 [Capitella teleta]
MATTQAVTLTEDVALLEGVAPVVHRLVDTPIVRLSLLKDELPEGNTGQSGQRSWQVTSERNKQNLFTAVIFKGPPNNEEEPVCELLNSTHPLVIKLVDVNRKIAAEVHSPGGNLIAYLSKPRGGKVKILDKNEEALHDVTEHDYNPILSCFMGHVSDQHSVHPRKKKENIGAIDHVSAADGTKVTMSAALNAVSRAALLGVSMLLYNNIILE